MTNQSAESSKRVEKRFIKHAGDSSSREMLFQRMYFITKIMSDGYKVFFKQRFGSIEINKKQDYSLPAGVYRTKES